MQEEPNPENCQAEGKSEESESNEPRFTNLREEFDKLPLGDKVAALFDMTFKTAGDAFGEIFRTAENFGKDFSSPFTPPKTPTEKKED